MAIHEPEGTLESTAAWNALVEQHRLEALAEREEVATRPHGYGYRSPQAEAREAAVLAALVECYGSIHHPEAVTALRQYRANTN